MEPELVPCRGAKNWVGGCGTCFRQSGRGPASPRRHRDLVCAGNPRVACPLETRVSKTCLFPASTKTFAFGTQSILVVAPRVSVIKY